MTITGHGEKHAYGEVFVASGSAHSTLHQPISSYHRICYAADYDNRGRHPKPAELSAASERHRHTGPLGGAWEANPGYTEFMRGKAACHSVGPILWHLLSLVAAGGTDGL